MTSKIDSNNVSISIHAPVKGATGAVVAGKQAVRISIHAPVKGATKTTAHPRSITGISIHAPVKGATTGVCGHTHGMGYFNPRSREGSDPIPAQNCRRPGFQSTLP